MVDLLPRWLLGLLPQRTNRVRPHFLGGDRPYLPALVVGEYPLAAVGVELYRHLSPRLGHPDVAQPVVQRHLAALVHPPPDGIARQVVQHPPQLPPPHFAGTPVGPPGVPQLRPT